MAAPSFNRAHASCTTRKWARRLTANVASQSSALGRVMPPPGPMPTFNASASSAAVRDRLGDERGTALARSDIGDDDRGVTTLAGDQRRGLLGGRPVTVGAHDRGALPRREHGDRTPVADRGIGVVGALGARTDDQHPSTGQAGGAHRPSLADPRPGSIPTSGGHEEKLQLHGAAVVGLDESGELDGRHAVVAEDDGRVSGDHDRGAVPLGLERHLHRTGDTVERRGRPSR